MTTCLNPPCTFNSKEHYTLNKITLHQIKITLHQIKITLHCSTLTLSSSSRLVRNKQVTSLNVCFEEVVVVVLPWGVVIHAVLDKMFLWCRHKQLYVCVISAAAVGHKCLPSSGGGLASQRPNDALLLLLLFSSAGPNCLL